ncbi:GNAT family N-acetyltransferase [Sphaerisporangium sp. B11E5]|uniref:GNAT family N-acetyltransferase n=1 Tax=Sphaerisporangium sp. B11E5 TaxID=3153563 RepID=UPI00325E0CBE
MVSTAVDEVSVTDLPVRRLGPGDLRACLMLAIDRRWLPEEAKWRLLFDVGEVYGVDDPAGGLAGTVVLTRYGPDLAAVSMVLVATRHGRRGLGRRLMLHVIDRAAGATLFLTATPYGRPVYERVGFTTVGEVVSYTGHLTAAPADGVLEGLRPARAADLPGVVRLDTRTSGAPRERLMERLPRFASRTRVVERGGQVTGFGAVWRNVENHVLGPILADGTPAAIALIAELSRGLHGPVRLDLDSRHTDLAAWASRRGLSPAFSTALMVHGGALPGDRHHLFAPVMVALG